MFWLWSVCLKKAHTHARTPARMRARTRKRTRMSAHTRTHMPTQTHVQPQACECTHQQAHMHARTHTPTCTHSCTHKHAHDHPPPYNKGMVKVSFYIAQYPVRWTAQRALHFPPLADLFIPTPTRFSWKHSSHAAIAQRLFTHMSTTVYGQVLIYTAESTGASWRERKCPNF